MHQSLIQFLKSRKLRDLRSKTLRKNWGAANKVFFKIATLTCPQISCNKVYETATTAETVSCALISRSFQPYAFIRTQFVKRCRIFL